MADRRALYVVYCMSGDAGSSVGRELVSVEGLPEAEPRLSMDEVKTIEHRVLKAAQKKDPSITIVFLTWWQWLRPGNGSSPPRDDAAKIAGHAKPRTTAEVYDREHLEAHRRFAGARLARRAATEAS